MRLLAKLRTRWRALVRPASVERDLADELNFHLQQQSDAYQSLGLTASEARAAAHRDFGPTDLAAERCRDARGVRLWLDAVRDARFGWRAAMRAPGTMAAAVATLALGIGTATAMFSVVDAVLLRPLPFTEPERLVRADQYVAAGALALYERQAQAFDGVGIFRPNVEANLLLGTSPERVRATFVSAQLLPMLGVHPLAGRTFRSEDTVSGAARVVVLSEAAWQRRLGGRGDTIGRSIRVDGVPHEVIGILPSRSMLPLPDADVWLPAITQGLAPGELWGTSYYALIGRVRAGMPLEAATADLRRLAPIVRDSYPWRMPDVFGADIAAIPLLESAVGDVRTRLGILAVAVALLLASACANVATLVLSRALVREKEFAVRAAIGASRRRLLQQLLTETLLLWLCGGVLGLLVAWFGLDQLRSWLPPDVPRVQDLAVDWRAVAVSLGATLFTGLGFGVLPAWRMSRPQLVAFLKPNDGGVATTAGRQRVVKALVVAQLSSAVVLVTGSVVLSRSVWNLTQVPPGFDPTGVLSVVLTPDRAACETPEACRTFYQSVLDRLTALPHVTAAGYANLAPLAGETNIFAIDVQDHAVAPGAPAHTAMRQVTSPGYFDALDLAVVRGRPLQSTDADSGDPVVLINEAFARRFWPGQDPIGKRLRYVWQPTWRTIVGVVPDVKQAGLALPAPPAFYLPYGQDSPRDLTLFVESSAAWPTVASDVRRVVAAISPDVPVSAVQPVQSLVDRSLAGSTALLALITLFGAVVVLLGGIGTYGVLASTVAARRRELGIRLALGASPSTVRRLVVGDALRLCAMAVVVGTPLAVVATRSATSLLYGTGATDIAVPVIVLAVMSAIALAAAALPAVRAARVDVLKAVKDA